RPRSPTVSGRRCTIRAARHFAVPPPRRPGGADSVRTLIADDDSSVRGLVRRGLTRQFESLDIVECENGLAALELLTSGEFDLVLLDVSMPLMDGLDVLRSV